MSSNKKQNVNTISVDDFEPSNFTFSELAQNKNAPNQSIGFPRYLSKGREDKFSIQLPWMNMFTYGIPKYNEQYYKTDNERAHLKMPLDVTSTEVKKFYDKMVALDNLYKSDEMKRTLFPDAKKLEKYEYTPLIKIPSSDDDEEETATKPPHMKLRLHTTWPDVKVLTEVYHSVLNSSGKRDRTRVEITTVDDICQQLRWKCNYSPIIEPVSMWADKKPKMGSDKLKYGIIFRLTKVQVEPSEGSSNSRSNADFIDDDDDMPAFKTKESDATSLLQQLTKKSSNVSDDEEEEPVPVKQSDTSKQKAKAVVESDEDEEDEEEEEPVPEPPKKATKGKATVEKGKKSGKSA